jgi:hypothetical protein
MWILELKSLRKDVLTLLEASLGHLRVTPSSHFALRRLEIWFLGLLNYPGEQLCVNVLDLMWKMGTLIQSQLISIDLN